MTFNTAPATQGRAEEKNRMAIRLF